MRSSLTLAAADLAHLVQRGLGERVRGVRCVLLDGELRLIMAGLDASRWLPRLTVEIAVVPLLHRERQEVELRWRVVPSSLVGLIAAPVQQLGVGAKVIDALIDRLGGQAAVIRRDNEALVLALHQLAFLQRLGITVEAIAISVDALVAELALTGAEERAK